MDFTEKSRITPKNILIFLYIFISLPCIWLVSVYSVYWISYGSQLYRERENRNGTPSTYSTPVSQVIQSISVPGEPGL